MSRKNGNKASQSGSMYAQLHRLPTCDICRKGNRVLKLIIFDGKQRMACSACEAKASVTARRPVMR